MINLVRGTGGIYILVPVGSGTTEVDRKILQRRVAPRCVVLVGKTNLALASVMCGGERRWWGIADISILKKLIQKPKFASTVWFCHHLLARLM